MELRILLVPSCDMLPVNNLTGTYTLKRLEKAMELWRTGDYDLMVLSGGYVSPKTVQTKSHAEIMAEWVFLQPGAPEKSKVIIESRSRDTYENAIYSDLDIFKWEDIHYLQNEYGCRARKYLTIVTGKLHGDRFKITFKQLRLPDVDIKEPDYKLSFGQVMLEKALLLMHILDPMGEGYFAKLNQRLRSKKAESHCQS